MLLVERLTDSLFIDLERPESFKILLFMLVSVLWSTCWIFTPFTFWIVTVGTREEVLVLDGFTFRYCEEEEVACFVTGLFIREENILFRSEFIYFINLKRLYIHLNEFNE